MTTDNIESQIESLNEEKRDEFEERLESSREQIERRLHGEYRRKIENQIDDDKEELQDFNIVISAFLDRPEIDYTFVRTEPLYHEGEKNFDVLIASLSKGIAVFIECERSLISSLPQKLSEFLDQVEVIEENTPDGLDVDSYLSETVGRALDQHEHVISSKQLSDQRLTNEAKKRGVDFIAWDLTPSGNRCKIRYHIARSETKADLDGHVDEDLMAYIEDILLSGIPYMSHIDFTYSSSKYLKVRNMVLAIINRHQRQGNETFDFGDWKDLFAIELSNYQGDEKETLYVNFIDYGKDCGVITLEEDLGDLLDNKYRIISRATRNQENIVTEIYNKITRSEMDGDLEEELREEKQEIVTELKRDQATGGTTLSDFVDD